MARAGRKQATNAIPMCYDAVRQLGRMGSMWHRDPTDHDQEGRRITIEGQILTRSDRRRAGRPGGIAGAVVSYCSSGRRWTSVTALGEVVQQRLCPVLRFLRSIERHVVVPGSCSVSQPRGILADQGGELNHFAVAVAVAVGESRTGGRYVAALGDPSPQDAGLGRLQLQLYVLYCTYSTCIPTGVLPGRY